jgi:hypothetical protein
MLFERVLLALEDLRPFARVCLPPALSRVRHHTMFVCTFHLSVTAFAGGR